MPDLDRSDNRPASWEFWGPIILVLILIAIWANTAPVVGPDVRAALGRADRHLAKGRFTLADRDVAFALGKSPDKMKVFALVTALYQKHGYRSENMVAERLGRLAGQLIELNDEGRLLPRLSESEQYDLLMSYAMSATTLGRRREALAGAERLYKMEPNDPVTANMLGYLLAEQNLDLARAEQLVLRALELQMGGSSRLGGEGGEAMIVDSLGWVYFRQGRFDEAVRELERAVEVLPSDAEVRYHLGCAYLEAGDDLRAKIEFKKALACDDKSDIHARVLDAQKKMRYKLHKA